MLRLDRSAVVENCGARETQAGQRYLDEGRVTAFERDGDTITAAVRGSVREPYRQTIVIEGEADDVVVEGECTCPVGFNCKHVAAALLRGLKEPASAGAVRAAEAPQQAMLKRLLSPVPAAAPTAWSGQQNAADGLPRDLSAWFGELERAGADPGEDHPPGMNGRMIYLLQPVAAEHRIPHLAVQPISARLKKNGDWHAQTSLCRAHSYGAAPVPHMRPSDSRIMTDLARMSMLGDALYKIDGHLGFDLLERILATGRARWLDLRGPVLALGPSRAGRFAWRPAGDTALVPWLDVDGPGFALAAAPPVYADPAAGLVGPVETGQPPRVAGVLLRAPPVEAAVVPALNERLAKRAPSLAAFAPPLPRAERMAGVAPVPVLRLFRAELPAAVHIRFGDHHAVRVGQPAGEPLALARLSFLYGEAESPLGEAAAKVKRLVGGRLLEVERDPAAEKAAVELLLMHGFVPAAQGMPGLPAPYARDLVRDGDALAWYEALYDAVPALRSAGWRIEIADDFPHRLLRGDGEVDAELREGSGIDWLELHLGVMVDGERVDLVGPLVAMISAPGYREGVLETLGAEGEEPVFLPLPDGRVLALPYDRLRPMVEAMRELALGQGAAGGGALRLGPGDAARLAEFELATEAAALRWRGGESLRELGRRLTAAGGVPPVAVPDSFRATLRPYQADGVAWLSLLRQVGLGGILADDMGLGKTVQALAFLCVEKAAGRLDRPVLVVAPTSLMGNWAREAARFAPGLRVLTLHGLAWRALFDGMAEHDVVLTTHPLAARDREVLAGQPWHAVLLDEAQVIKNPDAATTQSLLSLDARHRFCLTGTPLENNLAELWSLFSFACPGLLGERRGFGTVWRTPIEKHGDAERGRLLARRIRPFLLRRTKDAVARDLPPKTEMVERVDFEPAQRDVCESIRLSMHEKVRRAIAENGWARSRIVVLDALLKLRQACCDPRLLKLRAKGAAAAGSAKLERLDEMLRELLAEGRRVIVFSQFTSMLDLIRPRLDAAGIRYSLLTGSTRDRPAAVAAFDTGAADVFLISLKAGGVGLNLVSADTVVLYDPWWNPAVEAQAIDRAHRIGQTKPVFVHKLVATGTIEEKMEALKERKAALAASLFDPDGEPTLAMTEADIEMLLAP